ncbi:MAG: TldD/PmbA family protein [Acidimicrobiales bacterium]|jgi:predicted Zn-dependent protease
MSLVTWFGADQLLTTLEAALADLSAEQVEISATSRVGHHTRFAGDRIHQAQSITECQVMVRAVVGTGSARVAVNSLERVPRAVAEASALARSRDGLDGAEVPYDVAEGPIDVDTTGLWVENTLAWDVGARSRVAGSVMAEAGKAGGTVNGTLTAASTELAVVTSRGVRAHGAGTEAGFTMTVRFGEASSYIGDLSRDAGTLNVHQRALAAVDSTAQVHELVPVPDGVHDVVFGPLAAGELVGFVPDFGFTAPAVRAGIGLVAQRRGEVVAPDFVTIADDARAGVGLPFPFDFEGSTKKRVLLIDRGRVGDAVSDRASAAVSGGVSTGHASIGREQSPEPACANLVMAPGVQSEEELIAGVGHGLYVQRLWYNRLVDAEAGTVVGTSRDACFLIEDGRRTQALAGGRFNESVIEALRRTDALSSLCYSQPIPNLWNSCITAPAMRVRGFCFGTRTRLEEGS